MSWSAGTAIHLHVIDAVKVALLDMLVVPVSSSIIRWLLSNGRVRDAGPGMQQLSALRQIAELHADDFRLTANQNLIIAKVASEKRAAIALSSRSSAAEPCEVKPLVAISDDAFDTACASAPRMKK